MAALWLRFVRSEVCSNCTAFASNWRINRPFLCLRYYSKAVDGEKFVDHEIDELEDGNDNRVGSHRHMDRREKSTTVSSSLKEYEIPYHGNSSLHDYVKKLEESTARGKGTILKSWSRLTRQPKNPNLNVSGGFKTGSLQCLGLTTHLLEERLKFLSQVGIKGKDALIISLEFPAILSWDCPNFSKILKVLLDLNCDIVRLMCRTPFVFGLEYARVTENIQRLTNAGVEYMIIGKLVSQHPLILSFPLRDDSLDLIKLLLDCHKRLKCDEVIIEENVNEEKAVLDLLLQPLEKSQEQVNLQDKFKQVISFLYEMQVSPLIIAAKNPMVFNTDVDTLRTAIEFFTSKPLLLEMEVIQELLTSRSELFVNFDAEVMYDRVQLIYDIVKSPTALYNIIIVQSGFVFEKSNTKMEDIIQCFRNLGIGYKEICELITLKNFFSLEKQELSEKVEYLLKVDGITMESIKNNPACLLKPLSHLKERVEFLKANKPNVLNDSDLGQIMTTKNKEFSTEVCGSSLEHFDKFVEGMTEK